MILISCRKNFDSNTRFSNNVEIRDYTSLANLESFATMSEGELVDVIKGQHVVVLVHGFRNPLKNVAPAYAKVEKALAANGLIGDSGYGVVLGFLWPGFQTPLGFFPAVPHANRSAGHFRALLQTMSSSARTIDVQSHSLGARVVLQAAAFKDELWIDNLMIIAPAVDNESLEPTREFNDALDSCRRCIVYHSEKDKVLKVGYLIGGQDIALGLKGPEHREIISNDCPQVFVVDCTAAVSSHGGYRDRKEYFAHWKRLMTEAPLKQFEKLQAEPVA